MSIASQIEAVIAQRQNQAKNVEIALKNWENLKQTLKNLENKRLKNLDNDTERKSNLSTRLNNINFSQLIEKVNQELNKLENLKNRLSRQTLNIGVVGRMRQGKSTLLKSITGLSDDEIPTSSGGVCTKVLSKIFHEPQMIGNDVEFHSWPSFKEILHLYFDKLGLQGVKPNEKDDVKLESFPRLPEDKAKDENARHLYGRLRKEYYSKFETYQTLLDGRTKAISKAEIKQYTTQDDENNSEYLAVKEMRIRCQFPYDEVGKIGVIDLPGLGDNPISDVELLIKTLREDIDFIIFVRRPDPMGCDWEYADREMYTIARAALGEFPIKECSLMVFNKIKEQEQLSLKACQRLEEKIEAQEIKVCRTVIADCTDSDAVKSDILIPALQDLTKNINSVYQEYFKLQNDRLKKLRSEISQELQKADKVLEGYSEEDNEGFNAWFLTKLWKQLSKEIYAKLEELDKKQNDLDPIFKAAMEKVIDYCNQENEILTTSDIQGYRYQNQNSWKIAYYFSINEVKDRLTNQFKTLATTLEESEKQLQLSVVKILSKYGNLERLTQNQEVDFFKDIEKALPSANRSTTEKLVKAFQEMQNSTTTYKDIIIGWIEEHLDELNPDQHLDPISKSQLENETNEIDVSSDQIKKTVSEILAKDNIISLIKDYLDTETHTQLLGNERDISSDQLDQLTKIITKVIEDDNFSFEEETSNSNPIGERFSEIGLIILKAFGIHVSDELIRTISRLIINQINSFLGRQSKTIVPSNSSKIKTNSTTSYSPDLFLKEIDDLRKKVVRECHETLKLKLNHPNYMAHSKYSKFVTLAFNNQDAKIGWQDFYSKHEDILYPLADQKGKNEKVQQDWEKLVQSAIILNEEDSLFLQNS
ncbi:dynamin family protein [Dolichospermum circinale]|uniref:dynamin family protein n=1 Tax=Dolichospermum circinale TaxID=109265 RepID=UPI00041E8EB6|nr:dynamin family protein [Dolichospermum circinale]